MAGVKGKSGGPRKNAGGARPGAGRKPKAAPVGKSANPSAKKSSLAVIEDRDMLQLLQDVALGRVVANTIQVRAAIAAVQYTHTKRGDGGKKDEVAGKSKTASQGRFKPAAPPLKLVGAK